MMPGIVTDFTIKLWDLPPGNLTIAKFNAGAARDCSNSVLQTLLLGPCRTVDRGFLRCLLCQPHAAPDQHHRQPAELLYFCPLQTCCLPILPALRAAKKDVKGQLAFLRWFQDSWTQSADPRMGVAVSAVCGLLSRRRRSAAGDIPTALLAPVLAALACLALIKLLCFAAAAAVAFFLLPSLLPA